MSKKHVKEEIIMWWYMHFFRNVPKSKTFIFCFLIETPRFRNAILFYIWFIWHVRLFPFDSVNRKSGTFQTKFCIKKWGILRKNQKMNRNWMIFGHFEKMHIPCIINSSFTCFLEHFMFPRKQSIADWRFDQVFGTYLCRCNFNRLTLFEFYDNWPSSVRMFTVEKWKFEVLIITKFRN